jgi:ketosteroid isomerase-like protein
LKTSITKRFTASSLLTSLLVSTVLISGSSAWAAKLGSGTKIHPRSPKINFLSNSSMQLQKDKAGLHDESAVQTILKELLDASNRHDVDAVMHHYSPNFTSGDSLSIKEVRSLILDTWKMFPDIHYETQTLEVRMNGDWAAVESIDTAQAAAKVDPAISEKAGVMKSRSRGMLYLHRTGKTWEIVSDATLYEKATISYGLPETTIIDVETPEQVFAGESYSSKVLVSVPPGNIAFATLSQEPLTYPQHMEKDKFRTLSSDKMDLERIFKANSSNNNEVVTATIGFTEIGQDDQERPTINLKGVMTIVKRVNVIPKSTYKSVSAAEQIIHTTADGKVKIDPKSDPNVDDDSDSSSSAPDSSSPNN